MGSSIGPSTSTGMTGRIQWLADRGGWSPRGVGIDVSLFPKANSTSDHPWYDASTGKWVMPTGTILAKITASGFYIPIKRLQVNGAAGAGVAVVTVDDADHVVIGDTYTDGVLSFVVLSVDYAANIITATANFGGAGLADNALLTDAVTQPGAEGLADGVKILLEDCEYTGTNDLSVSVIERAYVNESAMPYSVIPASTKALLDRIDWV